MKSIINIELLDIKELKNNLMMLKSNTKWSFHFQHNDDRIHLIFKPDELGHIGISGVFKSVDYKDQLDFKFETDQTFILFMLKQCDEILKNT